MLFVFPVMMKKGDKEQKEFYNCIRLQMVHRYTSDEVPVSPCELRSVVTFIHD